MDLDVASVRTEAVAVVGNFVGAPRVAAREVPRTIMPRRRQLATTDDDRFKVKSCCTFKNTSFSVRGRERNKSNLNPEGWRSELEDRRKRLLLLLREFGSPEFKLLAGLTVIAVVEAVTYAWIEVLLYTSNNPVLYNTWLIGQYTSYHVVLVILVLAMVFGVGFVAWSVYSPSKFRRFLFLSVGDLLLWALLEDEFFFVFSRAQHTPTDWTNWILGSVKIGAAVIPTWYILAALGIVALWTVGLTVGEGETPSRG